MCMCLKGEALCQTVQNHSTIVLGGLVVGGHCPGVCRVLWFMHAPQTGDPEFQVVNQNKPKVTMPASFLNNQSAGTRDG